MSYLVVSCNTDSLFCQHSWSSCCLVSFNLRITTVTFGGQMPSFHPSIHFLPGSKVSVSAEETESSQPSREVSRPTPPQPVGRMSGGPAQMMIRWALGRMGIGVMWSLPWFNVESDPGLYRKRVHGMVLSAPKVLKKTLEIWNDQF